MFLIHFGFPLFYVSMALFVFPPGVRGGEEIRSGPFFVRLQLLFKHLLTYYTHIWFLPFTSFFFYPNKYNIQEEASFEMYFVSYQSREMPPWLCCGSFGKSFRQPRSIATAKYRIRNLRALVIEFTTFDRTEKSQLIFLVVVGHVTVC